MSKQIGAKKKRVQYSTENMAAAINVVRSGSMSKKQASRVYQVPRTTLNDKLSGRVPENPTPPGPSPVLTKQEESVLVNYIDLMHDIGYPLTKTEFLLEVKRIMDIDGRPNPFPNNLPGKDWYSAFRKRNPSITTRVPQSLGHERAAITEGMITNWYKKLYEFLSQEVPDYEDLVKDPRRIFNADESGFPLCVKSDKVLAPVGSKHIYQVVVSDKTQITVMACMNAVGNYMPPMILYPGERFRDVGIAKFPEAIFAHTPNGWMDTDCFVEFLKHLKQFVSKSNIASPILLIVDGHSTHISLAASKFCRENGIVLYCLLPNATHILQACDVGLFSPMKAAWTKHVKQWQMQHIGEVLTKRMFPEVFRGTWYQVATFANAWKGFQKSGLFPLSSDGIDRTKLAPSKCFSGEEATTQDMEETNSTMDPSGDASIVPANQSVETVTFSAPTDPSVEISSAPVKSSGETSSTPVKSSRETPSAPTSNPSREISFAPTLPFVETSAAPSRETSSAYLTAPSVENSSTTSTHHFKEISSVPTIESVSINSQNSEVFTCSDPSPMNLYPTVAILQPPQTQVSAANVSSAFDHLRVPEIKKKVKRNNNIREKLPKALSGVEAIALLEEREKKRIENEELKIVRKEEREKKKLERENERQRKKEERERKRQERADQKIKKMEERKRTKKRSRDSSESDYEGSEKENIPFMDTSSEDNGICFMCGKMGGRANEWVGCEKCPNWCHIKCTGEERLINISSLQEIQKFPFVCQECFKEYVFGYLGNVLPCVE
ncbi:LOW QUALITY PROTEIN: uncharacterized protein LOC117320803 [Pecten maximus]|uniref:LOW QUALITY PROTEIN: uncharacterized protein LOC117320803 n=1 Tax=Pecten maximus TaxID=6579 RepID=UPI00145879BF|nr:LOW QUALITY PROTEIN: uncharacterized protein LOC117320803 [Pecten maximus]